MEIYNSHSSHSDVEGTMDDHEMKFDRKQFYAAVCIDLTAAFNSLPDYAFRTMAASVREYLRRLEMELDKCER